LRHALNRPNAADSLLRAGMRPTIEKIRAKISNGSPNTNPMLDAWWKTLSARLDSGPAALHRPPESVAHIAEALWMQALEEGKRRVLLEQRDAARVAELDKQRLELRSHVLALREGELDSRLRDRDRTIADLNLRLRELTGLLHKEQATRANHSLVNLPPVRPNSWQLLRLVGPFGLPPSLDRGESEARLRLASRSRSEDASPPLRCPYRKADDQRDDQEPQHHSQKRAARKSELRRSSAARSADARKIIVGEQCCVQRWL
jgi:Plasmid replication region DNA-binding N-term